MHYSRPRSLLAIDPRSVQVRSIFLIRHIQRRIMLRNGSLRFPIEAIHLIQILTQDSTYLFHTSLTSLERHPKRTALPRKPPWYPCGARSPQPQTLFAFCHWPCWHFALKLKLFMVFLPLHALAPFHSMDTLSNQHVFGPRFPFCSTFDSFGYDRCVDWALVQSCLRSCLDPALRSSD